MKYTILFARSVQRELRRLPRAILSRVKIVLHSLQEDPFPSGCKKLKGCDKLFRLRMGNYRIVYEVAAKIRIVTIIRIGHRKEVYRAM